MEAPRFRLFYFSYFFPSLSIAQRLNGDAVYITMQSPTWQKGRVRQRENNELGSRGEYLIFIESRVSGRGFWGFSSSNPFLRFLLGLIVFRFRLKMFPHLTPSGGDLAVRHVRMWFGGGTQISQALFRPGFTSIDPKKCSSRDINQKCSTAPEAKCKWVCCRPVIYIHLITSRMLAKACFPLNDFLWRSGSAFGL